MLSNSGSSQLQCALKIERISKIESIIHSWTHTHTDIKLENSVVGSMVSLFILLAFIYIRSHACSRGCLARFGSFVLFLRSFEVSHNDFYFMFSNLQDIGSQSSHVSLHDTCELNKLIFCQAIAIAEQPVSAWLRHAHYTCTIYIIYTISKSCFTTFLSPACLLDGLK